MAKECTNAPLAGTAAAGNESCFRCGEVLFIYSFLLLFFLHKIYFNTIIFI
jgi:hypothetical protein